MGNPNVDYTGTPQTRTRKVFYAGATALKKNQPLCWVTTASDPNSSSPELSMGYQVEIPATASLGFLAGILMDGEEGKTNTWVNILTPLKGEVVDIRVEGTTDIAVGDLLSLTDGHAYFTKATATAALTTITIADAAGTPDYALQALTTTTPYGLATQAEAISLLYVIKNLQVRLAEADANAAAHFKALAAATANSEAIIKAMRL